MIGIVIVFYLLIFYFEFMPLYKAKRVQEYRIYIITFFIAFIITALISLGVKIPSPAPALMLLVQFFIGK